MKMALRFWRWECGSAQASAVTFRAFAVGLLCMISAPAVLYSQYLDFEVTLTSLSTVEFDLDDPSDAQSGQEARAIGVGQAYFGDSVELFLRGSYTYTLDRAYLFDLERLYVQLRRVEPFDQPGVATVRFGRTNTDEPTGIILSHPIDGVRTRASIRRLSLALDAGYTGLILKPVSRVFLSEADFDDQVDDDVKLGPPRLLAQIRASVQDLIGRGDLTVGLIGQFDLRGQPDSDDETIERYHQQFLLVRMEAPVGRNIVYDLYASAMFAQATEPGLETDNQFGVLGGASIDFIADSFLRSVLSFRLQAASGDDDNFSEFVPVTDPLVGAVLGAPTGGHALAGASYSVRPFTSPGLTNFQIEAATRAIFGVGGDGSSPFSDEGYYIGQEVGLGFRFRPFSDFGIGVNADLLIPSQQSIFEDPRFRGELSASLSF